MKFRVKEIIYEEVQDDGTVVEHRLSEQDWDPGFIKFAINPLQEDQRFWIASSHDGLMEGKHVIASPVPGIELDEEVHQDRTNTLIGLIRDGACQVFAAYDIPELGVAK